MVMAPKTRGNTGARTGYGKAGRRQAVKKSREIPWLPITVGGILLAFAIAVIVYGVVNNKPAAGPVTAAGIPCDQLEQSKVHYHAGLQIVDQGEVRPIPSNLGIVTDSAGNPTCYYWLHVHAGNTNLIHVEAPANQIYTLGQFFAVWSAWNKQQTPPLGDEPLDATHVSSFTLTPGQKLVVYVTEEGKSPQLYTGDPKAIVLKNHEVITLMIAPPEVTPLPPFTFPSGL
ncbi:MAG: hypothetical protein NVS1B3_17190 [Candidatus Dormibacteraceae bacterium]